MLKCDFLIKDFEFWLSLVIKKLKGKGKRRISQEKYLKNFINVSYFFNQNIFFFKLQNHFGRQKIQTKNKYKL